MYSTGLPSALSTQNQEPLPPQAGGQGQHLTPHRRTETPISFRKLLGHGRFRQAPAQEFPYIGPGGVKGKIQLLLQIQENDLPSQPPPSDMGRGPIGRFL